MCTNMFLCISVYTYVYTYTYYIFICVLMYTYIYLCIYIYIVYIDTFIRIYMYRDIYMYVNMYIVYYIYREKRKRYTNLYVYIYTCVRTYIWFFQRVNDKWVSPWKEGDQKSFSQWANKFSPKKKWVNKSMNMLKKTSHWVKALAEWARTPSWGCGLVEKNGHWHVRDMT